MVVTLYGNIESAVCPQDAKPTTHTHVFYLSCVVVSMSELFFPPCDVLFAAARLPVRLLRLLDVVSSSGISFCFCIVVVVVVGDLRIVPATANNNNTPVTGLECCAAEEAAAAAGSARVARLRRRRRRRRAAAVTQKEEEKEGPRDRERERRILK